MKHISLSLACVLVLGFTGTARAQQIECRHRAERRQI
jgi:hypothetical protein